MVIIIDQQMYHDGRAWVSTVRLVDSDTGEILRKLITPYRNTTLHNAAERSYGYARKQCEELRAQGTAYYTNRYALERQLEQIG